MCLRATILRPLRSKRAMISPVRLRSKASGLTRIRVLSTWLLSVGVTARGGRSAVPRRRCRPAAGGGLAVGRGADRGRARVPARARRSGPARRAGPAWPDLGLAVGADLPARVERLAALGARLLEPAQAARAAQEALLDLEVAVRAGLLVEAFQPGLGGRDLELALAHVVEVLGRAHDHVDDRADEREQRGGRGAAHQHRVRRCAGGRRRRSSRRARPDRPRRNSTSRLTARFSPSFVDAEDGEAAIERASVAEAAMPRVY